MTTIDCRSEEGITIGLIDTIITAAHALQGRDLAHPEVTEAIRDLQSDAELRELLMRSVGLDYDKVRMAYEIDALERTMLPVPRSAG